MIPEERKEITEECEVIISSAASTYFSEPLLVLLKTNYYGAVKVLDLAHECKKL